MIVQRIAVPYETSSKLHFKMSLMLRYFNVSTNNILKEVLLCSTLLYYTMLFTQRNDITKHCVALGLTFYVTSKFSTNTDVKIHRSRI